MASKKPALPFSASSVVFSADREKITKTLNVLQRKLKQEAHHWWQLGLQLKQHPAPLDGFKANPEKDPVEVKFEKMLQYWLNKGEDEYRTWGALAKAVDDADNRSVGNKIRNSKHYREHSTAEVGLRELADMLQQLAPRWRMLAINLNIPVWISDAIDNKLNSEDCLLKVLDKWITNSDEDEEPTLEVLYKAIGSHSVGNQRLADKIVVDAEVFQLLTVSKKEEDKKSVEEQLKRYIAKLKEQTDGVADEVDDLPAPPETKPGAVSSTSEQEKVLVENK